MQKFDTPGPVRVVLDIPAGSVRLIATDRTDTVVQVLPADASKKRDIKTAGRTGADYRDGVLSITTPDANRALGNSGSLQVTIELPAGSHIQGKAGAATLHTAGRLGDVTFEGAHRTVQLDEAASTRLEVHTGEVSITRLSGPAHIHNHKGDITIAEAVTGALELHTDAGNLSVTAAQGTSASLDAGTAHGRIINTLRNADGPAAALSIKATTSHGDITAGSR